MPLSLDREFIDYTTSMITDEDPLRGLLFYQDLGFNQNNTPSKTGDGGANTHDLCWTINHHLRVAFQVWDPGLNRVLEKVLFGF